MNTSNNRDDMQFTYANSAIGVVMTFFWNAGTSAVEVIIKDMKGGVLDRSVGSIASQDGQNIMTLSGAGGLSDALMADLKKAYYCIDSMVDWMSKMDIAAIRTGNITIAYDRVPEGIRATLTKEDGAKKMMVVGRDGSLNLVDSEGRKTPVTEETIAAVSDDAPLTIDGLIKKINSNLAELIADVSAVHQAQNTTTITKLNQLVSVLKTSTPDQIDLDVFIKAAGDLGVRVS